LILDVTNKKVLESLEHNEVDFFFGLPESVQINTVELLNELYDGKCRTSFRKDIYKVSFRGISGYLS
jgi:hypothetical protein